jgi:hypothetical protein
MIAEQREPARVLHDEIEAIAMCDKIALAVGRDVDNLISHLDPAEMCPIVITQEFIMISRNVEELNAAAALPQQLLHDIVMRLRPVPARFQLPAIDDVADQIDDIRFMKAEEIEQALGLTASRSKMYIGYEESAKSPGSFHAHHVASVR